MSQVPVKKLSQHKKATLAGGLVAAGLALVGGLLIAAGQGADRYGWTMFLILPVATGFATGSFIRPLSAGLLATVLSIALCCFALLLAGLEGIVCILMAAPLIIVGALLGALVGAAVRALVREGFGDRPHLMLVPLLAAFSVVGSGGLERVWNRPDRIEDISTSCVIEADPDQVWQAILSVNELGASKPFLLRIGLPVPVSCSLDGAAVGACRVCHFDSGVIEEEITAWEPPRRLEMRITRSTLPGRHWLHFETASYMLEGLSPGKTRVIRTTRIASKLRPGWYWRWFEQMGVEAEHRYLLESLVLASQSRTEVKEKAWVTSNEPWLCPW